MFTEKEANVGSLLPLKTIYSIISRNGTYAHFLINIQETIQQTHHIKRLQSKLAILDWIQFGFRFIAPRLKCTQWVMNIQFPLCLFPMENYQLFSASPFTLVSWIFKFLLRKCWQQFCMQPARKLILCGIFYEF